MNLLQNYILLKQSASSKVLICKQIILHQTDSNVEINVEI